MDATKIALPKILPTSADCNVKTMRLHDLHTLGMRSTATPMTGKAKHTPSMKRATRFSLGLCGSLLRSLHSSVQCR
jgi:hypothetical protein